MQAISQPPRYIPSNLVSGYLTPPKSPEVVLDAQRTVEMDVSESDSDTLSIGTCTPAIPWGRSASSASPRRPLTPLPENIVERALALGNRHGTTLICMDGKRSAPQGLYAFSMLWANAQGADTAALASMMDQLGCEQTRLGLAYKRFAILKRAAAQPRTLACLKLMLRAMDPCDVRAFMRRHPDLMCNAAAAAGDINYANWLVWAFGDGQTQYISER